MGYSKDHAKRRAVSFRITELAEDKLTQVANLFNLESSQYAKAVLYKDLGVFSEPLDMRKRSWRRQKS